MKTDIAFWDTSAALPLCCSQIFTTQSKKWRRKYPKIVIWWGTSVEINSGLARLKRDGDLTDKEATKALRLWEKIYKSSRIVEPVERVVEIANTLPDAYELRAFDSFQLAAALVWCQEKPRRRPFITADERLAKAAEKAGFNEILLN
ncbi:MAG: type II toxin-antitoxin system VapC family toxin [Acidobacteriota bacterium]|nr:type II toxin-antitoxin system VapC family toxin [Acidobacteriota bacterium]